VCQTTTDTTGEEWVKSTGVDKTLDGCPCDFHSKTLTNEEARIALFKPISTGEEVPASVIIERFWHLWDSFQRLIKSRERKAYDDGKDAAYVAMTDTALDALRDAERRGAEAVIDALNKEHVARCKSDTACWHYGELLTAARSACDSLGK
jgi:NADPH-dependent glutamate synthase beta subunit-like oxidoreductase